MQVNVKEFLKESGITESFYPGKRLVRACQQAGEFKSHCVVFDWRNPDTIRVEVKAGLSGRDLEPKKLKYYPVSFQTPTYVEIEVLNDNARDNAEDEDTEGEQRSGGSSSGGGHTLKKRSLDDNKLIAASAFSAVTEGKIPDFGRIVEMVVLGTKIAAESFGNVIGKFAQQIQHAKISTTDLLAAAGDFVTKYTPPAFLRPAGDEHKVYKYDREKNADIGFRPSRA